MAEKGFAGEGARSAESANIAFQSKAHDEALDFLEQHRHEVDIALGFDQSYIRRLKRKLDFYIIPFLLVVYTFNFIDKVLLNVSFDQTSEVEEEQLHTNSNSTAMSWGYRRT